MDKVVNKKGDEFGVSRTTVNFKNSSEKYYHWIVSRTTAAIHGKSTQ